MTILKRANQLFAVILISALSIAAEITSAHDDPVGQFDGTRYADRELINKLSEFQNIYDLRLGATLPLELVKNLNCETFDENEKFLSIDCKPKENQYLKIGTIDKTIVSVSFYDFSKNQTTDQNSLINKIIQEIGPPDTSSSQREGWNSKPRIERKWGGPNNVDDLDQWYKSRWSLANPLTIVLEEDSFTRIHYKDRHLSPLLNQELTLYDQYWDRFNNVLGSILLFLPGFIAFFLARAYWRDRIASIVNFTTADLLKNSIPIFIIVFIVSYVAGQGGPVCDQQGLFGCEEYGSEYNEPLSGPAIFEFFLRTVIGALAGYYWAVRKKWLGLQ